MKTNLRKFLTVLMAAALLTVSAVPAMAEAVKSDLSSPFKAVYESVSPSVVGIQISTQTRVMNGRIVTSNAFVGSGVVISEDGYVLTNYHVVDGAESVSVISGDIEIAATYVAGDEANDVAVLKAEGLNLPAATLGDSDELSVGDWALVIGNPLGEKFANTLTVGVISGVDRNVASTSRDRTGNASATSMIQTDAAINSGNSGGGLFNIAGELVGITSMKLSNNGYYGSASIEGFGFAIPINTIKDIVDDLIDYGKVLYPRIGVTVAEISSDTMEPTKESLPASIWVRELDKDESPARDAGIEVNDLIVETDGERITTVAELQAAIRGHALGEKVAITVYRIPNLTTIKSDEEIPDGEYLTFNVEVKILESDK